MAKSAIHVVAIDRHSPLRTIVKFEFVGEGEEYGAAAVRFTLDVAVEPQESTDEEVRMARTIVSDIGYDLWQGIEGQEKYRDEAARA